MRYVICCLMLLVLCLHSSVYAAAPELINYQGRIVDGTNLVTTSTSMVFRLYDDYTGGSLLYQETQTVVIVDGLYTAQIGSNNPAPGSLYSAFDHPEVYLEVAVGGATLTPRERIVSVAYAFHAATADRTTSLQAGRTNLVSDTPFQDSELTLTIPFDPAFSSMPVVTLSLQSQSVEALGTVDAQVADVTAADFTAQAVMTGKWTAIVDTHSSVLIVTPTALAEVNGKPAMAYTFGRLRYEQADDANGLTWSDAPVVLNNSNVVSHCTMAVVNGRPAIAYCDSGPENLEYVRASDADGSSWPTSSITIDASGNVGRYNSLAIVDGHPAISYYHSTSQALMYVRATDVDGKTWTNAPVAVDTNSASGLFTSLAVVNGNPAISYMHFDLGVSTMRLMYARSSDDLGKTWPVTLVVDTNGNVGWRTSLAVVDGHPAIAYSDQSRTNVNYIRAKDVDGSNWNDDPIAVSEAGQIPSLSVIGGVPAISFDHTGSNMLGYVWARDPQGTIWHDPVMADSITNTGAESSLTEINGRAAIGYWGSSKMQYVIDGGPAVTLNWMAVDP